MFLLRYIHERSTKGPFLLWKIPFTGPFFTLTCHSPWVTHDIILRRNHFKLATDMWLLPRKIWCFGPDTNGPNLMIDCSKGVQVTSKSLAIVFNQLKTYSAVHFQSTFVVSERDQGQCGGWFPMGYKGGRSFYQIHVHLKVYPKHSFYLAFIYAKWKAQFKL